MRKIYGFLVLLLGLLSCARTQEEGLRLSLQILGTSDLHANLMDYDYYRDQQDPTIGVVRLYWAIKALRKEQPNSFLFDGGDAIQGSLLADYYALEKPLPTFKPNATHPVIDAMNYMGYDAMALGNHEFNYGLPFLRWTIKKAKFPIVNVNIKTLDHRYKYPPYALIKKKLVAEDGKKYPFTIGVIGVLPPQILQWDKRHLEGTILVDDIVEAVKRIIPEVRKQADLVVVLAHSGVEAQDTYALMEENASYHLPLIEGVDVVIAGHHHRRFPDPRNPSYPNGFAIDNHLGQIFGKAVVLPSFWGKALGVIDIDLQWDGQEWALLSGTSKLLSSVNEEGESQFSVHKRLKKHLLSYHNEVLTYVRSPIGEITQDLFTFFSLAQADKVTSLVNQSQLDYGEKWILDKEEYAGMPVLSVTAPFKAGRGGATDYSFVSKGNLNVRSVADMYVFPNTLVLLKVTGAQLKELLEQAASIFNRIDPYSTAEQELIDGTFPTYMFHIVEGLQYAFDITQKARYQQHHLIEPDSYRVRNILYQGSPLELDQEFILVTNNYLSSANPLINPDGRNLLIDTTLENREILKAYLTNVSRTIREPLSWRFMPIDGEPKMVFSSSPLGKQYLEAFPDISFMRDLRDGKTLYRVQFS